MTREGLNIAAECIGFVSALALTWQAYRLVRHQRAVRDLRQAAEHAANKMADLATQGADILKKRSLAGTSVINGSWSSDWWAWRCRSR